MPEGRFVSKSIAVNKQLRRVSLEADYLFIRCIPHLDRDGRIDGEPESLKAAVCPLRPEMTPEIIATSLAELDAVDLVIWYTVDGERWLEFPSFRDHQQGMKPDRERPSRVPSSQSQGARRVRTGVAFSVDQVRTGSGSTPELVPPSEVKSSEVKSREVKLRNPSAPNGAGARVPKYPHFSREACDRLVAAWKKIGVPPYARFRNAFGPLFTTDPPYTLDQLEKAIAGYALDIMDTDKGEYASPEGFVARVNYYVEKTMPIASRDPGKAYAMGVA